MLKLAFTVNLNEISIKDDDLNCQEVIFPSASHTGELVSIDLNTFKLSPLNYAPKIAGFNHACRLDKEKYFLHGGYIDDECKEEAYIINIKDKNYEPLVNGPCKSYGGSVLKNNKVYIFGGWNLSGMLDSCEIFDLGTKKWKPIHKLPQVSSNNTASLLNTDIVISGYHLDYLYLYNDSAFVRKLPLKANTYKIVCGKWIIVNCNLYEYEESNSQWIIHNINTWGNSLLTYTTFKKNQYIYFIDGSNQLARIDTIEKKLEIIPFT